MSDPNLNTPEDATRAFLEAASLPPAVMVLEPAAGAGMMMTPLREFFNNVIGWDIAPRKRGIRKRDFLTQGTDGPQPDLIITNPPFELAEQFVRRAHDVVTPGGTIVMLLRAAFLESERRRQLLADLPPTDVWFLRNRPSFTGDRKTDATMYAWFVWKEGRKRQRDTISFRGHII